MSTNSLKSLRPYDGRFLQGVWQLFGKRSYGRNTNEGSSLLRLVVWWFFAGLGVLIFHYFPFKLMAMVIMAGFVFWGLSDAIRHANRAPWLGVMNFVLGVMGLWMHWQVGLTFFSHHFEFILWWSFIISGVLSMLRRLWNAFVWWFLDKSGYQDVM